MKKLIITRKIFLKEDTREVVITYEGMRDGLVLEIHPVDAENYKYVTELKDKVGVFDGFELSNVDSTLVDTDDENLGFFFELVERVSKGEEFEEMSPSGDNSFKSVGGKLYTNKV